MPWSETNCECRTVNEEHAERKIIAGATIKIEEGEWEHES